MGNCVSNTLVSAGAPGDVGASGAAPAAARATPPVWFGSVSMAPKHDGKRGIVAEGFMASGPLGDVGASAAGAAGADAIAGMPGQVFQAIVASEDNADHAAEALADSGVPAASTGAAAAGTGDAAAGTGSGDPAAGSGASGFGSCAAGSGSGAAAAGTGAAAAGSGAHDIATCPPAAGTGAPAAGGTGAPAVSRHVSL